MSELELQPAGGHLLTEFRVLGVMPITRNPYGRSRESYKSWVAALKEAAQQSQLERVADSTGPYSLRVEISVYAPYDQGSDLDNYIKDIQDALADADVFGVSTRSVGSMKGDEHIDHLEIRRKRVSSPADSGVIAQIWSLD